MSNSSSFKRDYYDVLGVKKDDDKDVIKKAYYRLANKYHPDLNKDDPDAEEKFKEVAEAWGVISDDEKRGKYDRFGFSSMDSSFSPEMGMDDIFAEFDDIFSKIGDTKFGGGKRRKKFQKGGDIKIMKGLTLQEIFRGGEFIINYDRLDTCQYCEGTGGEKFTYCADCAGTGKVSVQSNTVLGSVSTKQICTGCNGEGKKIVENCKNCSGFGTAITERNLPIQIEAGVPNKHKIRIEFGGQKGDRNGKYGDLFITIVEESDQFYLRFGDDIHFNLRLNIADLYFGKASVEVFSIDGESVIIDIPELSQTGERILIPSMGMKVYGEDEKRGDMIIIKNVYLPETRTEILDEFVALLSKRNDFNNSAI